MSKYSLHRTVEGICKGIRGYL